MSTKRDRQSQDTELSRLKGLEKATRGRHQVDSEHYDGPQARVCLTSHWCTVHLPPPPTLPHTHTVSSMGAGLAATEVTAVVSVGTEVPDRDQTS